jgi:hypothetical protein
MRVLKRENWDYNILAYTSLVRPILAHGSACWDPCRGQISVLDQVQKKDVEFINHTKDSDGKPWLSVGCKSPTI